MDIATLVQEVEKSLQQAKPIEDIYESISYALGNDIDTYISFVDALASVTTPEVMGLLRTIFEKSSDKRLRKAVKRSLYRLKTRGIDVEDLSLNGEEAVFKPPKPEPPMGFATEIDSEGTQLLVLGIFRPALGFTSIEAVVNDMRGLEDCRVRDTSRKDFTAYIRGISEKMGIAFAEMDPSYVAFRLEESYGITVQRKATPPQEYLIVRRDIQALQKPWNRPIIYSYLDLKELEMDRFLERARELLKIHPISDWIIEGAEIQPFADQVREARESRIVLTYEQRKGRLEDICRKALEEVFSESKRLLYKRRLEETAYLFLKTGKEEEAKISVAAALDLEKPLNTFKPNPLLFALVEKSLFLAVENEDRKTKEEPSLILKP